MSFSIPTLKAFTFKFSGVIRNWDNYCMRTDSDPTSYGILINGIDAYLITAPLNTSFTVNANQDLQNLITDYGVTISYNIFANEGGTNCDIGPITGNISVGMADITITLPGTCPTSADVYIDFTISGLPSNFITNFCCPLGYCYRNGSTSYMSSTIITLDA